MATEDSMDWEDADELARQARLELKEWEGEFGEWVAEAKLCYSMLHGDQWAEEDAIQMRDQKRPMVTFNRIASMIRAVCGLEVSQRQEVRYLAREMGDVQAAEIQNAAAKWAREGCDAEDEESEAFRDMLTCGMGFTETRVDREADPEGKLVVERIDPLDMRWDAMAAKKSLTDSRWRARLKKMPIKALKERWPDRADDLAAYVENTDSMSNTLHFTVAGDQYASDSESKPSSKDEAVVLQYQYWTTKQMVRVATPDGQTVEMPEDRVATMTKSGVPLMELFRFKKREYRQAIVCGPVTLEDEPLGAEGFTLNCMTGIRDRNKGYWYGLVRDMIDPQKWANKFFTTMIDILSSNAKGGVMLETSAVEDVRKFEENWANPRAAVWLKTGGLNKIQSRDAPPMPAAVPQMMEYAANALPSTSGINLEFLGTTNREQSGVLEYHRKQSVANSLAEFFAAMKQYRKNQGRVMLELIYGFLADGRLIRIVGKAGEAYVPLFKQADVKYDVIVDEAPSSPDRKMQTWLALQELLPMAMQAGLPVPPEVLDYTPLPSTLTAEWKKMITEAPPVPPQVQEQMQQMQQQVEQLQQENTQLKAKNDATMAMVQVRQVESQAKTSIQAAESQADMQLRAEAQQFDQALAMREFMAEMQQMRQEMALAREELRGKQELARAANTDD